MQIPALASALSQSFTHSDSTHENSSSQLHFHDPHTPHEDESQLSTKNKKIPLSKPFDVVVFPENPDLLLGTLFDEYNPTTLIVSYSEGIITTDKKSSNSCTLKFYNYGNLKLKKVVNIFAAKQINYIQVISNLLLFLTSDNQLMLFDPVSSILLSKIQLSYHFTAFKQMTNLDDSRTEKKLNISLYTFSSCCQLIQIDLSLRKLSQLSVLIYLPFWPTSFLSIEHKFFYFFGSSGEYQLFSIDYDTHVTTSFPSSKSPSLIDPNYGKLQDVHALGSPNSFIFLQENGWTIYQYQQPSLKGEGLSTKVSNSLNNLQLIISSPLPSSYEKMITIKDKCYILMSDRNITLISDNHIQLVESVGSLLDVFPDYTSPNVLGIFSDPSENKSLKVMEQSTWIDMFSYLHSTPNNNSRPLYKDSNFTIKSCDDRIVLQNSQGKEVGTLFDICLDQIQVIDLNLILNFENSLKYFLILDSQLKFQLLVLDQTEQVLLKSVEITSLRRKPVGFSSVYFHEKEELLEFIDDSGTSIIMNINSLALSVSTSTSKGSKLIVFDSAERQNLYNEEPVLFASFRRVSIDEIRHYSKLFSSNPWLGIIDSDLLTLHRVEKDEFVKSPELLLLYTIVNGSLDKHLLKNITKYNIDLIGFVKRVTHFCIANNSSLIEASIDILYEILTQEHQIIRKLFEQCISEKEDTLVSTVLMILCVSFDKTLLENYNTNQLFQNIICYALLFNEKICELCLDVLSKLKLENFRITDEKHGNNNFDLINFFNDFFYVRSTLFSDREKRNLKNFQKCNRFLDSLLEENILEFWIIICTIIESEAYTTEDKKCLLDYIIYVFIEKKEELKLSGKCNMVVFLLVNSIFTFISRGEALYDKTLKNDDSFWESMNLLFNVLCSNFSYLVTAEYHDDWKTSIYKDKGNIRVVVILDILGYVGIVYSKIEPGNWFMRPVKSSRLKIPRLDMEAGNSDVNVRHISERLMQNETGNKSTELQIRNPVFFIGSKRMALINLNTLSVQLWNLESDAFRDNLSIEVLKDDSVPLKIPDFSMLMFQYIWKFFCHESDKEGDNERFTKAVEQFHYELVDRATPPASPFTSPKRKTLQQQLPGYTYSDLATICEPYGEHQFGFLLDSYLQVFPTLKASDIGIAVIDSNNTSVQLQLTLRGHAIFVFTSPE